MRETVESKEVEVVVKILNASLYKKKERKEKERPKSMIQTI